MRKVSVIDETSGTAVKRTGLWLLDNFDDVEELISNVTRAAESLFRKTLTMNIDFSKPFDLHKEQGFLPLERALFIPTLNITQLGYKSFVDALNQCAHGLTDAIYRAVCERGETVIMNQKFGWRPQDADYYWGKVEGDFPIYREPQVVVNDATTVINIENDSDLEANAVKRLEKLDKNYSFVTDLRSFNADALTDIFRRFVGKGGELLYVYTTGRDTEQIRFYTECARNSGLKKFSFELSAARSDDFLETMKWLKTWAEDVKVK